MVDHVTPANADPQVGDVAAMLRVMRPLEGSLHPVIDQRRLLADLCRFIGAQVGAGPVPVAAPPAAEPAVPPVAVPPVAVQSVAVQPVVAADDLPPRAAEVLCHLLAGDSEKQVARRMRLSFHTVHGHVKVVYRRYGVSSRAELLALHLRR